MSFIIFTILFAVLGIGLGVLFCLFIVKKFPEDDRKIGYIKTVFIFFLTITALAVIVQGRSIINSVIDEYSEAYYQSINEEHANAIIVMRGYDLSGIGDDTAVVNDIMKDIRTILPTHRDLGISNRLYNFIANPILDGLQDRLMDADGPEGRVSSYTDENNIMTVLSVINGIRGNINRIVNIIFIVLLVVFIIILLIHVIKSLVVVSKEKNRIEENMISANGTSKDVTSEDKTSENVISNDAASEDVTSEDEPPTD